MRPMFRYTLFASLALLAAACGGSDTSPPPPPTYGTVQLSNQTSYAIDEVYLSASTDPTWGVKRNSAPVPVSGAFSIGSVVAGSYDLLCVIVDTPSRYYASALGFSVDADATTTLVAHDWYFTGSFRVTNGTMSPITGVYFVPTGSGSWGSNQLSASISVSSSWVLNAIPSGYYDYQCVHQDSSTNTGSSILITSLATAAVTCS